MASYSKIVEEFPVVVKSVTRPDLLAQLRAAHRQESNVRRMLSEMLDTAALDMAGREDDVWNEVAKMFDYESADAVRDSGHQMLADLATKTFTLRKRAQ